MVSGVRSVGMIAVVPEKSVLISVLMPPIWSKSRNSRMLSRLFDYVLSKIPRGRFVTVEEIASLISWLASKENSFTTGAVFDISGGRATY